MIIEYRKPTASVYRDGALVGTVTASGFPAMLCYTHQQFEPKPKLYAPTIDLLLQQVHRLLAAAKTPTFRK